MPMMKTICSGTTSVASVQSTLEQTQIRDREERIAELRLAEQGVLKLDEGLRAHLEGYLESFGFREVLVDVSDGLTTRRWGRQMDLTLALHGHDQPTSVGRCRTYYHYLLSPDPADGCTLAMLRAYAKEWAKENFRRCGRLHEYAIVCYHSANGRVLAAHVIVCATNEATGCKLHMSKRQIAELEISANEIGLRYGLSPVRDPMQGKSGARTLQPTYIDTTERKVLQRDGTSWKQELRLAIADACACASNFAEFESALERTGYDVTHSKKTGYLTYTHPNGKKCQDRNLGALFSQDGVEAAFGDGLSIRVSAEWMARRVMGSSGQEPIGERGGTRHAHDEDGLGR